MITPKRVTKSPKAFRIKQNESKNTPGSTFPSFRKKIISSFQNIPWIPFKNTIVSTNQEVNMILVSLNNFQEYLLINLQQLLDLGHKNIYLITDQKFFNKIPETIKNKIKLIGKEDLNEEYNFYTKSNKDFWALTSARFFYIYALMKKLNLENVFHLENDVLIYYNCGMLLSSLTSNHIYIPFDCYKRSIASIVYFPNHEILKILLDHYSSDKTDMENFSLISKKINIIENFPIFNSISGSDEEKFVSKNFDKFKMIFDAAAIGQYLGGIDPVHRPEGGNTKGFINETCIIKYNIPSVGVFAWDAQKKPFLTIPGGQNPVPIFNLHIHSKKLQEFKNNLFDIVIPVGPKDIDQIKYQIEFTKKNVIGYRNIYLIMAKPEVIEGCITILENTFPFNLESVASIHGKSDRNGWYLQQILKLYAGLVIPNILSKYLIIDADTYFLKPTFFLENGVSLYNTSSENIPFYFIHMKKLHPSFIKIKEESGISHHMMMETKYVKEIIALVESQGKLFWQVFLESVEPKNRIFSGASEYELYFNYMLKNHPDNIRIRNLRMGGDTRNPLENLQEFTQKYDYVSWHWFNRK